MLHGTKMRGESRSIMRAGKEKKNILGDTDDWTTTWRRRTDGRKTIDFDHTVAC